MIRDKRGRDNESQLYYIVHFNANTVDLNSSNTFNLGPWKFALDMGSLSH